MQFGYCPLANYCEPSIRRFIALIAYQCWLPYEYVRNNNYTQNFPNDSLYVHLGHSIISTRLQKDADTNGQNKKAPRSRHSAALA